MIFDAFSAQGKIFPLNEIRYFFGRNHDFEVSLHVPPIKTSEIIIYPKLLKNHQKMNVSPSVDGIGRGSGGVRNCHRIRGAGLYFFFHIVQSHTATTLDVEWPQMSTGAYSLMPRRKFVSI